MSANYPAQLDKSAFAVARWCALTHAVMTFTVKNNK